MSKYTILNAVHIAEDTSDGYDYIRLELVNDKGIALTIEDANGRQEYAPIPMSMKLIDKLLLDLGIDASELLPIELMKLVRSMVITASVPLKEKGQTVVADEFTGLVTVDGKKWTKIKEGQKYKVFKTNYRIDYRLPYNISFPDEVAFFVADRVQARIESRELKAKLSIAS